MDKERKKERKKETVADIREGKVMIKLENNRKYESLR